MPAADSRLSGRDFLQRQGVHRGGVHGCVGDGGGALQEGAGSIEGAFFAAAMDGDDAGGWVRGQEGEELLDEAGADRIEEAVGFFDAVRVAGWVLGVQQCEQTHINALLSCRSWASTTRWTEDSRCRAGFKCSRDIISVSVQIMVR